MNRFNPFTTSLVGSYPRSEEVKEALVDFRKSKIGFDELKEIVNKDMKKFVKIQEEIGIDVITTGELYRDNYMSFVADRVGGIKMMSLEELMNYSDHDTQEAFRESIKFRAVSEKMVNNPICVDKIDTKAVFESDFISELIKMTDKPVKATIPSPYLLTRSLWLEELSGKVYKDREELGKDVILLILNEVKRLIDLGVYIIQLDDPILAEVVFTGDKKRAFYCGALSEKVKFDKELSFARDLIKPIVNYIKENGKGTISALHVCRGNFTRDEAGLLKGSYKQLSDFFCVLKPDILMLEYSTPRAGKIKDLFVNEMIIDIVNLGLGVINPRSEDIETVEQIQKQVEEALGYLSADRICLNPDCGFATFSNIPLNSEEIIQEKMKVMVEAAHILRKKYN